MPHSGITTLMDKKPKRMRDLTDAERKEFAKTAHEILNIFVKQTLEPMFEGFKGLVKVVENQAEFVAPLLQKSKLWYFPSMPIDIGGELMRLAKQGGEVDVQKIEQVFIDFYDQNACENIRGMTVSWFDTPIFERRKHIIEDALDAHISGKYTLSIPVLLTQVEGILSEITGASAGSAGKLLELVMKKGYTDDNVYNPLEDDILLALSIDPFLFNKKRIPNEFFTTEKIGEWMNSQGIETIPLNRNAILHGIQINYNTKINSLRVFFLLDSIYWVASEKMKIILNNP